MNAEEIIKILELEPLDVEGGMYKKNYFSKRVDEEGIPYTQAIYYLLTEKTFSHMHRLTSEEVWHFYMGDVVEICELKQNGNFEIKKLGDDLRNGERPQQVVSEGSWQGARLVEGGKWALMGTMMCPCYSDGCYEHGYRETIVNQYPKAEKYINCLTEK